MDILFTRRYKYTTHYSVDNVRADIESIIGRRWYDFSVNMTGRFKSDGSFILTHKWSLAIIRWVETSPAYLNGTLSSKDNKTIIETSVRPNSAIVLLFYLFILLFLVELFGRSIIVGESKTFSLIFFLAFGLLLFGLIKLFTIGLRNRFEKLLRITREE